jgi:hypothetical protein
MKNQDLIINMTKTAIAPELLVLCKVEDSGDYAPVKRNGEFLFVDLGGALQETIRSGLQKPYKFLNARNFFDVVHMEIK